MRRTPPDEYFCDRCHKKLLTCDNHVIIVTPLDEHNVAWSRLRVIIQHHHGSHNNGEIELADLCQDCARILLDNATKRVESGERTSEGVESPEMKRFSN